MTNEVVVTGIGMISPVGNNINNSWENLVNGNSGIDYIKSFEKNSCILSSRIFIALWISTIIYSVLLLWCLLWIILMKYLQLYQD